MAIFRTINFLKFKSRSDNEIKTNLQQKSEIFSFYLQKLCANWWDSRDFILFLDASKTDRSNNVDIDMHDHGADNSSRERERDFLTDNLCF